ncbi:MAG: hypothetical protein GF308_20140 [Candidatus Heimdallarchaeota archaeon]|nr:hypothetical protein [Candidatus Heimdallarchaeota archaeon]
MKFSHLVGKVAADKNSQRLGNIVNIEKLPRKSRQEKDSAEDTLEEHLIILVRRLFKRDIGVAIDSEKIIKVEGNYVWLDLLKEEFEKAIKESKELIERPESEIGHKDQWKPSLGLSYSAKFYIQPRPKAKKRKK